MTRRVVRTQWVHREEPQPEPESPSIERAKSLPMFGPGRVFSIPLHLLIEYTDIYKLEPSGIQEPKVQPKYGPGEAILLVKRMKQEGSR
jgi:hypothetical protein